MLTIDVAIETIIPDNTAFTVLTTLRHLGYHDLKRVERSEHLLLDVDEDARPDELVAQLACVEIVFNPNKHRLSYALPNAALATPPELEAFVRDKDENNDRLLALLTGPFGLRGLRGLLKAVAWRLYDEAPAAKERLEWACTALLANAVSQTYDIHPRPVRIRVGEPADVMAKGIR